MTEPGPTVGTAAYYEALATELEDTAEQIRRRPQTNHNLAQRLKNMADAIRSNLAEPPSNLQRTMLKS